MLDHNRIKSIPVSIAALSELRSLSMFANALTSVPAELGNLPLLVNLDLELNQLRDSARISRFYLI